MNKSEIFFENQYQWFRCIAQVMQLFWLFNLLFGNIVSRLLKSNWRHASL